MVSYQPLIDEILGEPQRRLATEAIGAFARLENEEKGDRERNCLRW